METKQRNRYTYQWNKMEKPNMDPYKYAQLIPDEEAKTIQ